MKLTKPILESPYKDILKTHGQISTLKRSKHFSWAIQLLATFNILIVITSALF